jgi:hypothetical protein
VTQRLSDIADGIRQNCDKWVVFRTSSPEDLNIVRVGGDVLSEVVTHLGKGYAYIRLVNPRRLEGYRYTSEIMAVTDGYIFSMERKLLDIEVRKRRKNYSWTELATLCYRCNAVIKDIHNCHICKKPPMLIKPIQEETVETNTAQNNGQAGAGNTKPNGNGKHGEVKVEEVSDKLIEEARQLALREIIREEDKKVLSSISMELLRKLISCVRSGKFDEELFKSGLAVNEDGKIRPTRGARLFLKFYNSMHYYDGGEGRPNNHHNLSLRHSNPHNIDDMPKGLVGAKAVFYIIAFTAVFTAVLDPSKIVFTLPAATFVSFILAFIGKRGRRRARRVGYRF